ncbi:MAG TPA: hypothetical protein VHW93_00510 [Acidimicrobiales bacterium]|jgi:hypothetical protein|nr:hypothetical protein [Acidimicrobiales bacterium]
MSDPGDDQQSEALGAGAKDSQSGDQVHSPGATRRVVIALVIVVLIVAFAAALSFSGARGHRHAGLPTTPAQPVLLTST